MSPNLLPNLHLKSFGHVPLDLIRNSLRTSGIKHYYLCKNVARPTKDNPENGIYILELYFGEGCILYFDRDGFPTDDWRPKDINGVTIY